MSEVEVDVKELQQQQEEMEQQQQQESVDLWPEVVDVEIHLPSKQIAFLPSVNVNENLVSIRTALAEFQETVFFTCFKWKFREVLDATGAVIPKEVDETLEFSELGSFLEVNAKKVVFDLLADLYDAKKAKLHVKRVRDTIQRQFLISAAPSVYEQNSTKSVNNEGGSVEETKSSGVLLPKIDQLPETNLGSFFREAFKTGVSKSALEQVQLPLSSVIKSIFISGWNPVPAYRKLQGDLLYIEVVFATEGTFYVTATARGFFVNKSNRATFDPSPANNPHFYHCLFDTLNDLSGSVKVAWTTLCDRSKVWSSNAVPGAFDAVINLYSNFNGNFNSLPANSWIAPSVDKKNEADTIVTAPSTYDMLRTQDFLCDLQGVDELGAPREWNDEIQSIRNLKANDDLSSKILKARLEHRMISEFTDVCKKIVVAISEGLIAPLTYSDPSQSDIYVYNGIFFSRAEDTKDTFSIHVGAEACRKAASRDFQNQKLIRSLDIKGMNNILCTLVDYKGIRYVGQSIIPGIFSQGEHNAQLMYGVLEKDKLATVKHSSLESFEELASKLQLSKRRIPAVPFKSEPESTPVTQKEVHVDALTQLLQTADSQATPIRVDEIGNVEIDPVTNSLPHAGPIESKLIRGSDGRTYALEIMRLTPRDANYVSGEKGSQKLTDEELSKTDVSISATYILRQELVSIYMQRKVNLARQALLNELAGKERSMFKVDNKSVKNEADVSVEDVKDDEGPEVQIVKEEVTDDSPNLTEEDQEQLAANYREKFSAITPESLGIEVNPNVFLNFESDVDPAVVAKDEEVAREMAVFLIDSVLPMLTRQVREGDVVPKDSDSLVNLLHRMGVNMRYLGRLAKLALDQEREDAELMFQNKQRVHSMPYFWLEFLTIELLSRSAKHILNDAMMHDSTVRAAPACTIAALLNQIVAILRDPAEQSSEVKESEDIVTAKHSDSIEKKNKKTDKKGKKSAKIVTTSAIADSIGKLDITQVVSSLVASKDAFVAALSDVMTKRYLHESPLLVNPVKLEGLDDKAAWAQMHNSLLRSRISPLMLVRRICQQCGVVLACKNYDFKNHGSPFSANDILAIVPKVKSCEPDTYLPEVPEMLSNSANLLSQGNAVAAFEHAQQGLNIVTQITGPLHLQALQASEQLTSVLVHSADTRSAGQVMTRSLSLTAQVQGVDNHGVIQHHIHLAIIETELGSYQVAFDHLAAAKYLLELVGGNHHPDMIVIFTRLSLLYEKVGDFESALHSLVRARMFVHDLFNNGAITMTIANLLYKNNRYLEAVQAQKSAYRILKELMNPEDERVADAKKTLEVYLRAAATVPRAVENQAPIPSEVSTVATTNQAVELEDKDSKKKKTNKKRGKK